MQIVMFSLASAAICFLVAGLFVSSFNNRYLTKKISATKREAHFHKQNWLLLSRQMTNDELQYDRLSESHSQLVDKIEFISRIADPEQQVDPCDRSSNDRDIEACRKFGFWCSGPPWVSCDEDHPQATEDVNRLIRECVWDEDYDAWVQVVMFEDVND